MMEVSETHKMALKIILITRGSRGGGCKESKMNLPFGVKGPED